MAALRNSAHFKAVGVSRDNLTPREAETATARQLAARYGITTRSMWRFLRIRRIAPVGQISTRRRPAYLYRVTDIYTVRRNVGRRPTTMTLLRLALALRD